MRTRVRRTCLAASAQALAVANSARPSVKRAAAMERMPVPRTNFREGDRVRLAAWWGEIAGATGTVVEAILVTADDWAAQDLLVRFDRPVTICKGGRPTWTFCHSAHNFEYADEAGETQRGMEAISDTEDPPSSPRAPPSLLSGDEAAFQPFTGAAHRLGEQEHARGNGNPAQKSAAAALPNLDTPLIRRRLRGKQPPPPAYGGADRCSISMSCADKYMEDAEEFYAAYKAEGGKFEFDGFQVLLRAFFEHTLNSHVWGERADASRKDKNGFWLHPSPDHAESAWAAETGQTASEFRRVFEAVDSVHAYT